MNLNLASALSPFPSFDNWPGMERSYDYIEGPCLRLWLRLDESRYDPATDTQWEAQAERDAVFYEALASRWAEARVRLASTLEPMQEGSLPEEALGSLGSYIQSVCSYLRSVLSGEAVLPLVPFTLQRPVVSEHLHPGGCFELLVTLTIAGTEEEPKTESDPAGEESVEIREIPPASVVPPALRPAPGDPWPDFVYHFKQAFATTGRHWTLCLPEVPEGATGQVAEGLWVLRLQGSLTTIGTPFFLGLPPLSNLLLGKEVALPGYSSSSGLQPQQFVQSFSAIDLDEWAGRYLVLVEALRRRYPDALAAADRAQLVRAIAARLEPLFDEALPEAALQAARAGLAAELEQSLLASELSVLVHYRVDSGITVEGTWNAVALCGMPLAATEEVLQPLTTTAMLLPLASEAGAGLSFPLPAGITEVSSRQLTPAFRPTHIALAEVGQEQNPYWFRLLQETNGDAYTQKFDSCTVPLPLRAFPPPAHHDTPQLQARSAGPRRMTAAGDWCCAVQLQGLPAAQDSFVGWLGFYEHQQLPLASTRTVFPEAFFDALACFHTVFPALEPDLDNPERSAVGLAAFAELAGAVARAWPAPAQVPERTLPASVFELREAEAADGSLQVQCSTDTNTPPLLLEIDGYARKPLPGAPGTSIYTDGASLLRYAAAREQPRRRLCLPELNVFAQPGLRLNLALCRNGHLAGRALRSSFVYYSSWVGALFQPVYLEHPECFGPETWNDEAGPKPLQAQLQALFTALLPRQRQGLLLKLTAGYAYELVPEFDTTVPLTLVPVFDCAPATAVADLSSALDSSIQKVLSQSGTSRPNGRLQFDITLSRNQQTLLHLPDVRIPLAALSDLPE